MRTTITLKKTFLTLLVGLLGGFASLSAAIVTFSVDMNEYTGTADYLVDGVTVNGTFNDWCGACAVLTDDDADGVYNLTIDLPNDNFYEFKYTIGPWTDQEMLTPGTSCTLTTDGNTNRTLVVGDVDLTLETVCWNSCNACGFVAMPQDVTFSVDMNEYAGTADYLTEGVTLNGTFNGWCGDCTPMTDDDADGIYTVTIVLEEGLYEFKYAIGPWTDQEALTDGSSCTLTTDGFTNRTLTVGDQPVVFSTVCWNSCEACGVLTDPQDVTFSVDMNGYMGTADYLTEGVTLNGTFNGWCGACAPMSDDDADGVYTLTLSLNPGNYEFKYAIGAWVDQENLLEGSSCTLTTDGFTNRTLTVEADPVVFPTTCFGACVACEDIVETPMYQVTFRVDMNAYTGANDYATLGVNVNGTFNDWCGDCWPLDDSDADGIYEATFPVDSGIVEFKYVIGNWVEGEEFVGGESCTNNPGGFWNRYMLLSGDLDMDVNCFNSCEACPPPGPFNDDACAPLSLLVNGDIVLVSNENSTPDGPQGSCWTDNAVESDIWFIFEAPASGAVAIQTYDSGDNDDTQIAVYSSSDGTCTGDLTEVGCNDDISDNNLMSFVTIDGLNAGETYWIQVDGSEGATGEFNIQVSDGGDQTDCPAPTAIICDNFDTYALGLIEGQAAHWDAWTPGSIDVASVTDARAFSNNNSLFVGVGNSEDNMLLFGDQTQGNWETSWRMYVPSDSTAYYNFQAFEVPGNGDWVMHAFLEAGTISITLEDGTTEQASGSYPEDTWFEISHVIDLDNDVMSVSIDGQTVTNDFVYNETLGGVNFYANGATNSYYIDDVVFNGSPDMSISNNDRSAFSVFPNPTRDLLTISGDQNIDEVLVRNVLGAIVLQVNTPNSPTVMMDLANMEEGVYLVEVLVGDQIFVSRVIKR